MYTKDTRYSEVAAAAIEAFNSKSTIKYDKNKPTKRKNATRGVEQKTEKTENIGNA